MAVKKQQAKYKSPKQLGISALAYGTLIRIMWELRDGIIPSEDFDMELWDKEYCKTGGECGTAHCIGGWMAHYKVPAAGRQLQVSDRGINLLGDLYYPPKGIGFSASPKVAANAIEHVLKHGRVPKGW